MNLIQPPNNPEQYTGQEFLASFYGSGIKKNPREVTELINLNVETRAQNVSSFINIKMLWL